MVDLNKLDSEKGGGGKSKSKSKKPSTSGQSGGGSSGSSSGSVEPHTTPESDMVSPEGKEVSDISKEWAGDKGNLNFDAHSGEGLKSYMTRQVNEVEEMHENIREMARKNNDNFDEFTLYMHAMFINFGQNRVGIAETIQDNFGKSKKESVELANKICQKAGEPEFMENMVQDITENMADL